MKKIIISLLLVTILCVIIGCQKNDVVVVPTYNEPITEDNNMTPIPSLGQPTEDNVTLTR